uniref:Uncharacterized protein n=2 Tax=Chrysotila carterae TaxID=13221 RepID=A0A7S4BTV3_CHRCT
MHVQLPLAVSYYAIEAVRLSFNASVMFIDMRRLERSFAASVEAAKVAFMAASGGASVAAQATGAAARNLPPSLQILQDEIDDLRAAEKGLRMRSRKLQLGAGAGAVGWIVLFLCPFLWNKATYIVCAQGVGHAFTYMTMADTLRTGLRGSIKYPIVQQV